MYYSKCVCNKSPHRQKNDFKATRLLFCLTLILETHRQKKVHLQTLRERSEVHKMSPRERMRLRKLQAADEKAKKLK